MKTILFLLEEASARACLESLLPRVLPDGVGAQYIVFEGKQDLEKQMVKRIRGWQAKNTLFVVMRDQDAEACKCVKKRLVEKCSEAGRPDALVRIACRELESWFVGDWSAVAQAFDKPRLVDLIPKRPYREPDILGAPHKELQKHIPQYTKIDGARRIGRHLDPHGKNNRSESYKQFVCGLRHHLEIK